ncbi:MAG: hypothetical protein DSY40_01250, partial [Nautilia sp.]
MNLIIVFGGSSYEHEISIVSAITLKDKIKKHNLTFVFVDRDRDFYLIDKENLKSKYFSSFEYKRAKKLELTKGGFKYKNAGFGPYSHYVDNSVECADFINPYGDQAKPRCTVPEDLSPGSVVELHGGPYQSLWLEGVNGSREKPIFIRGYRVDD